MTYLLEGVDDTITFLRNDDRRIYAVVLRQDTTEQLVIKRDKADQQWQG